MKHSNYPHNPKPEPEDSEPEEYDGVEEFEPKKYEESIAERTKIRRQKKSDEKNAVAELNKQVVQKGKIINKELFKE